MAETLEWFQCKACGRRHRWKADIAGSEIPCPCGSLAFCPEVEIFSDADASDTVVEPMPAAPAGPAHRFGAELGAEAPAAPRTYRGRGLSPFTTALLWSLAAAFGFILIIHALIVQWWGYIVLTVLWTPFSFWKFLKARKRWQGNRSLKRAFLEQVDPDSLAD